MVKSKNKYKHEGKRMDAPAVLIPLHRILYWAYGSNLSVRQMRQRCPKAGKSEVMIVDDCALVFRRHADVTVREGAKTHGGLWTITEQCEAALDRYEGVSSKTYLKRYLRIKLEGDDRQHTCLFYQMKRKDGIMPPSERYIATIAEGYADFGLPLEELDKAVAESWGSKEVPNDMLQRHLDGGMPSLAREVPRVGPSPRERSVWGEEWS